MLKSQNPILMLGTYLGGLSGWLLSLKGWHIFWFVPAFLGVENLPLWILNIIGGALVGYFAHILWRVWVSGRKKG